MRIALTDVSSFLIIITYAFIHIDNCTCQVILLIFIIFEHNFENKGSEEMVQFIFVAF